MKPISWTWYLVASCLLAGVLACGDDAEPAALHGAAGALSGVVYSSGPVAGAHIQVLSEGGDVLADVENATDVFGRFGLTDLSLPDAFRVEASGGAVLGVPSSATLSAEGASANLTAEIQLNPLSTLWAACRDKGIGPSDDELDERLATFLELPPHWRYRDLVPEARWPHSFFSLDQLVQQADAAGGLDAFIAELADEVAKGGTFRSFAAPENGVLASAGQMLLSDTTKNGLKWAAGQLASGVVAAVGGAVVNYAMGAIFGDPAAEAQAKLQAGITAIQNTLCHLQTQMADGFQQMQQDMNGVQQAISKLSTQLAHTADDQKAYNDTNSYSVALVDPINILDGHFSQFVSTTQTVQDACAADYGAFLPSNGTQTVVTTCESSADPCAQARACAYANLWLNKITLNGVSQPDSLSTRLVNDNPFSLMQSIHDFLVQPGPAADGGLLRSYAKSLVAAYRGRGVGVVAGTYSKLEQLFVYYYCARLEGMQLYDQVVYRQSDLLTNTLLGDDAGVITARFIVPGTGSFDDADLIFRDIVHLDDCPGDCILDGDAPVASPIVVNDGDSYTLVEWTSEAGHALSGGSTYQLFSGTNEAHCWGMRPYDTWSTSAVEQDVPNSEGDPDTATPAALLATSTLGELYESLYLHVSGSHVSAYNVAGFGDTFAVPVGELVAP